MRDASPRFFQWGSDTRPIAEMLLFPLCPVRAGSHCGRHTATTGANSIMDWTNAHATGIPAVDDQHKVLFKSVNDFRKALEANERED